MARRCSVCSSPSRSQVEGLVLEGVAFREIARRFDLSKDSVTRHAKAHMVEVLEAADADRGARLIADMEALQERTLLILSGAEMQDYRLALAAIREARHNTRLIALLSDKAEVEERLAVLEREL